MHRLLRSQPDPAGARVAVLRVALVRFRHIEALFFDFSSLYQAPRTPEQDAIFVRATHTETAPLATPHVHV